MLFYFLLCFISFSFFFFYFISFFFLHCFISFPFLFLLWGPDCPSVYAAKNNIIFYTSMRVRDFYILSFYLFTFFFYMYV